MSKVRYTEVICTTNMEEYKEKERQFIELNDKEKSMLSTYIRKVTFRSDTKLPVDYSILMEDMEDIFIEIKEQDDTLVTKNRIPISRQDADAILNGDYTSLKESIEPAIQEFYNQLTQYQLVPAYRKEFTRKTFHQNQYLDIIFDVGMSRKPYTINDFFIPRNLGVISNYDNLRMSIRHNLSLSNPMEQLLAFEKGLMSTK